MQVYILTSEYNDYDQHGEYFVDVFPLGVSVETLMQATQRPRGYCENLLETGGERVDLEYEWFYLRKEEV